MARRLAREHERDRVRILVGNHAALEQGVDEPGGCRAADLPLRAGAAALSQRRPYLGEHVVDLFEREPLALNGVPRRAGTHAERVAAGVDPLVPGPSGPKEFGYSATSRSTGRA